MRRKIISGTALMLLLVGMLAFNTQPIRADLYNKKNDYNERSEEEATIVEHAVTPLEHEKLRQMVGVWKEDGNYNEVINGRGTGLLPPSEEEWAEIVNKILVVERVLPSQTIQFPSSVDHTTKPWFPPIGDQGEEGSCVAWAVGYYVKTFQEAKEHGWNLSSAEWKGGGYPTPEYQDRIFSPDFIYHLINGGIDGGSSYSDAMNLIAFLGACSWENMPYDPNDHTSWPSEEAWREAPLYRGNSSGYEYLGLSTDDHLTSLKNWIASDHLAVVSVDGYQYSNLTNEDFWTLDNYYNRSTNHANTIVGYDNDIEYFEQEEWHHGAFKIANSWGKGGWENVPDGYYWISYEAMKQRVGYCMFYRDRIGYKPELVSSFNMEHSKRDECEVLIGMGDYTNPLATKSFSELIKGGDHPFCPVNIVFDITEFKSVMPTVVDQSFFMEVYDGGIPKAHSGKYEWYSDGESYSWFRLGQTFDIPETGATLKFWSYYEIEEDWDYGYVEVHDLDTDEWCTLPGLMTVSTLPERQDNPNCPSEFEPTSYYDAERWNAFTGFSSIMYQEEIDLTPFANHTIDVYFTYWTDPFVLERGWFIDDIEIPEIGFFDDVEGDPNHWTHNGWYMTTLSPPTTGTIGSFSIEYYHNYSSDFLRARSASPDLPMNTMDQNHVFTELILTRCVNVSEAKRLIESNPDLVILDVGTQEEYEEGHIGNAVLIPVSELEERIDELDKEKEILVYCRSGVRSGTASQILVGNGFVSVYDMLGGFTVWRNSGYWIEITHRGDLIIDGTQTFLIENCTYIQTGNIYVKDRGKLIISNTVLKECEEYPSQFRLFVEGYADLEIKNASMPFSEINIRNLDHASTRISNSEIPRYSVSCHGGVVEIMNSTVGEIVMEGSSRATIENASLSVVLGVPSKYTVNLWDIQPRLYAFWKLHEDQPWCNVNYDLTLINTQVDNWYVSADFQSTTTISNSTLGMILVFRSTTQIKDSRLGFYEKWSHRSITLENCRIDSWELIFDGGTIINSTISYFSSGKTNISLIQSSIGSANYDNASGTLHSNKTTFERFIFFKSSLLVHGDIDFSPDRQIEYWTSSNITRNYDILVVDRTGDPVSNTQLSLYDENSSVTWNGSTDNLGKANFNVTFSENNYTDTVKLQVVKGNYSATIDVGFLSDTPVVLTTRHFADLNFDGTVNIVDISIAAIGFGSTPEDPYWNVVADLNNDQIINVLDISTVAMEFGKTV